MIPIVFRNILQANQKFLVIRNMSEIKQNSGKTTVSQIA